MKRSRVEGVVNFLVLPSLGLLAALAFHVLAVRSLGRACG